MLKGNNALITGSKQGIGRSIAIKLASQGCNIGVNDIVKDEFTHETIDILQKYEVNVSWHKADISSKAETDKMIDNFIEECEKEAAKLEITVDYYIAEFVVNV